MEIKLSKKDQKELTKALEKEMKSDNAVAKILKNNKNNKLKLKVKVTTYVDPKTKEKTYGGAVELYETHSDKKILDGWNLDLGATTAGQVLLGISKDFDLINSKDGEQEWSIGGYVDVVDAGKKLFKKKGNGDDIKIKIGISKVF